VLRPILACRHILAEGTAPPMLFETLVDRYLVGGVARMWMNCWKQRRPPPELGEGPRVGALNDYIDASLAELGRAIAGLPPAHKKEWADLDRLFLRMLERVA